MKKTAICPKCGRYYNDHPAISRRNNATEICPECGLREALEDAGIGLGYPPLVQMLSDENALAVFGEYMEIMREEYKGRPRKEFIGRTQDVFTRMWDALMQEGNEKAVTIIKKDLMQSDTAGRSDYE